MLHMPMIICSTIPNLLTLVILIMYAVLSTEFASYKISPGYGTTPHEEGPLCSSCSHKIYIVFSTVNLSWPLEFHSPPPKDAKTGISHYSAWSIMSHCIVPVFIQFEITNKALYSNVICQPFLTKTWKKNHVHGTPAQIAAQQYNDAHICLKSFA